MHLYLRKVKVWFFSPNKIVRIISVLNHRCKQRRAEPELYPSSSSSLFEQCHLRWITSRTVHKYSTLTSLERPCAKIISFLLPARACLCICCTTKDLSVMWSTSRTTLKLLNKTMIKSPRTATWGFITQWRFLQYTLRPAHPPRQLSLRASVWKPKFKT